MSPDQWDNVARDSRGETRVNETGHSGTIFERRSLFPTKSIRNRRRFEFRVGSHCVGNTTGCWFR